MLKFIEQKLNFYFYRSLSEKYETNYLLCDFSRSQKPCHHTDYMLCTPGLPTMRSHAMIGSQQKKVQIGNLKSMPHVARSKVCTKLWGGL